MDLSLLVDGLRAEREQGITIDVAYRYFATDKRTFILADTPGHVQYTRNTVTGASTADVVIVLVDARTGVVAQTRRHAAVAALLGVPHLLLAVNKIDLVDYDQRRVRPDRRRVRRVRRPLWASLRWSAIPISALHGDNVVTRSERMPWYTGPNILEHLEQVRMQDRRAERRSAIPCAVRHPPAPTERPIRTTAATPGGSPPARSAPATRWSCCRRGLTIHRRRHRHRRRGQGVAGPGDSVTLLLADDVDLSRGRSDLRSGRTRRSR